MARTEGAEDTEMFGIDGGRCMSACAPYALARTEDAEGTEAMTIPTSLGDSTLRGQAPGME